MGIHGKEAADKSAKEATEWRLKKPRRGKAREVDTSSPAAKAELVKELISAKKKQLALGAFKRLEAKTDYKNLGSRTNPS